MIDLTALGVVVAVAAWGWFRGVRTMGFWGLSLVAGSVAVATLARPAGAVIGSVTTLSPLLAYPIAAVVVAATAATAARRAFRRADRDRRARVAAGWVPPAADHWGGAGLGAALGIGIALFVGWAAASLGPALGHEAEVGSSRLVRTSGRLGEPVVRILAGRATGDVVMASSVAYMMSDPTEAKRTVAVLLSDERLHALARDPEVRRDLEAGEAARISASPLVQALAADEAFVRAARRVQLVDRGEGPISAEELADAAVRRLGPMLRMVDEVRADPGVQRLLAGSGVQEALASGELTRLLQEPAVAELIWRVSEKMHEAR